MPTKPIKISSDAHGKYAARKESTGKSLKRLVEDGADALELLPKLIAAVEAGDAQPMKLSRLLAEAKTIV
jgi:hypothetical protein